MELKDLADLGTFFAAIFGLLAVWVTWLALSNNSQPQVLIYYQPSVNRGSMIDLIIENIGNGTAYDVKFSAPVPINWFGIEEPEFSGQGGWLSEGGIPALAPKQRYTYTGGQFSGLKAKLGSGVKISINYRYLNPLRFLESGSDDSVLAINHFAGYAMPRSADQAIVDALVGNNPSTIKEIKNSMHGINVSLSRIAAQLPIQDRNN